jgi:RNA polymerase sigma-70 factor, ECF subfamily
MNDTKESELVALAIKGDNVAWSKLYAHYQVRVTVYCSHLIHNRESVREIVQCAFSKAFESVGSLRDPGRFSSWLFAIARNEAYGSARDRLNADTILSEDTVWADGNPLETCIMADLETAIHTALGKLKSEYREVLILRHFESLSYADIAAITGSTLSSVESRLFKARKAMAALLRHYEKEES